MSHNRVSLGPHCNSLHHERCGKADSGNRGGEVRPRARARPAGRASPPASPRAIFPLGLPPAQQQVFC